MPRAAFFLPVAGWWCLTVVLAVLPVRGAQNTDDAFTLRVDVGVVSVDVSVTDPDGRPVTDLGVDDFEVFDGGMAQPIRYFAGSTAPYHAYLLVDASGSTANKWTFMQEAVEAFVGALKPGDRVALGLFGHVLTAMSDWDDPLSKTLVALEPAMTLGPIPGTSEVYEAIKDVLNDGFDPIRERKALIVLTDGRDTALYQEVVRSNSVPEIDRDRRLRSLLDEAAESAIPIYFVALNTDRNREPNLVGADEYRNLSTLYPGTGIPDAYLAGVRERMERIAEASGGTVLFPASIEDLRAPFRQIAGTLSRAYSIGYAPPAGSDRGDGPREIVVRVRRPGLVVRQSRSSYMPGNGEGVRPR